MLPPLDPESSVSTSSTTWACSSTYNIPPRVPSESNAPAEWRRLASTSGAVESRSYFFIGFQRAKTAPVGSWRMLNHPACGTSLTSLTMVAPSDLAFLVDAATSSTST